MQSPLIFQLRLLVVAALLVFCPSVAWTQDSITKSEILKWKDGKKAVFMLAFDDGCPSQLKYVVPELEKRKIPGTFYLVTGNNVWAAVGAKWAQSAKSPYVVVANHTFSHKGVSSIEELDPELTKCNEVLYSLNLERKQPRLLPFGKPGGVPWMVNDEELKAALARHHLVYRPPFAGPPIHYKSAEELIAVVDKALAKGDVGHLDMHGVGGDWLVTPLDWFLAVMDKLDKVRDQLWITDPASLHKYMTERESAELKVLESRKDRIRLALTSKTDPALYDEPLTLSTRVPADWKSCVVVQGVNEQEVAGRDGTIQYAAVPGGEIITIQPQ
ncbi:polysaccharide deacetylase family protein [Verrucomicrobiota bacterium sgz303538]